MTEQTQCRTRTTARPARRSLGEGVRSSAELAIAIFMCVLLSACAGTDPYKRLEPAPTSDAATSAHGAFNRRWPTQFKAVQTVTIDFRITTRTLVGYLIVQGHDRFRLQGMTEQGIKLFDIVGDGDQSHVLFAAEEFDPRVIENIARDIRRVFLLESLDVGSGVRYRTTLGETGDVLVALPARVMSEGDNGATVEFSGPQGQLRSHIVGKPPRVDWYDFRRDDRSLFRVDHYEWQDLEGVFVPTTMVLRERGVQSDGPPYKLTVKLTELTVRDEPWPDSVFEAGD
ncbi:MAG: DUF3261 domain-containing protein [Planctomycetes bacterium]|nr:DUF3261 domain-containing protein [Planctomycetota bacterium]